MSLPASSTRGTVRRAHAFVGLRGSAWPDRLRPDGCSPRAAGEPAPVPDGPVPSATEGATWQPKVIRGSERFRVFLDGEPVAGTVAASVPDGWVDVARGSARGDVRYEPDLIGERMGQYVKRRHGVVTLHRVPPGC